MNGETGGRACTNEQCRFAETGLCVEGNDINECPYLKIRDETASEDAEETTSPGPSAQQSARSHLINTFWQG